MGENICEEPGLVVTRISLGNKPGYQINARDRHGEMLHIEVDDGVASLLWRVLKEDGPRRVRDYLATLDDDTASRVRRALQQT